MLLFMLLACLDMYTSGPMALDEESALDAGELAGTWRAAERCGQTAGGSSIEVRYTLAVTPDGARLDADGYQSMQRMAVAVLPDGDYWEVVFQEDREDLPSGYRPGDVLMTLERDGEDLLALPQDITLNCASSLTFAER